MLLLNTVAACRSLTLLKMNAVTDMYQKSIFLVEHHLVADSGLFR